MPLDIKYAKPQVCQRRFGAGKQAILGISLSLFAGCSGVGPDYVPPSIALADNFVEGGSVQKSQTAQIKWWTDLNDRKLNALVAQGLAQNLSVQAAFQAVNAAQANARAAGIKNQIGGDLSVSAYHADVGADTVGLLPDTFRSATLSAGTAMAGIDRKQELALASLDAADFDVGTARLAYLSSVVGSYIDARYYQERLELTRQSIANNQRILKIVKREREIGQAAELNVAQAQAQFSNVSAQLPTLEAAFLASVYGIATLVSEPAGPLLKNMQAGAPQPTPKTSPRVGTPANLLRNRPDIQASERRYAAAVAAVGVAEAKLYPTLALSGVVSLDGDFDGSLFGPTLTLPVFSRGALKARRDARIAQAQQGEILWRASVEHAVQEVQTAQSAYRLSRQKVTRLREAVSANTTAFNLTEEAYQEGAVELLDLLKAELTLTQARGLLAEAVQQSAASWLKLQIATGSGWAAPQEGQSKS
ncbi:efflux transporter outer membrane subunit [Sulfitobacter sp.]|uniref:efflux transporter outer membrane subunit n=1 Tax=Sulfitobacter sp. TaxID=1903071 RepID=UPI003EF1E43B